MKYKIVVDSSSNLTSDFIKDESVGFNIAPLTIRIGESVYVDDDSINCDEMLETLSLSKEKAGTACPSPYDFSKYYDDAENIIVITISGKLSGSYNSAILSCKDCGKNIHVIDSKLTGGGLELIAKEAYRLMKEDKLSFEELCKELDNYRDNLKLLFVLSKYDNLVRNGRVSRVVALIAKTLIIKPLCYANDGEIEVKEKIRTMKGVLKRLIVNIAEFMPITKGKTCIISHTQNEEDATYLKNEISSKYEFDEIIIRENRGLCAFYSLEKGIIVTFG